MAEECLFTETSGQLALDADEWRCLETRRGGRHARPRALKADDEGSRTR